MGRGYSKKGRVKEGCGRGLYRMRLLWAGRGTLGAWQIMVIGCGEWP